MIYQKGHRPEAFVAISVNNWSCNRSRKKFNRFIVKGFLPLDAENFRSDLCKIQAWYPDPVPTSSTSDLCQASVTATEMQPYRLGYGLAWTDGECTVFISIFKERRIKEEMPGYLPMAASTLLSMIPFPRMISTRCFRNPWCYTSRS